MARVLIIDDNASNLKLGRLTLQRAGHEVVCTTSPLEALSLASGQPFDVILADIQMPEMDGFQLLGKLREMEPTRFTPVLAVTAHAMRGDAEKILAAGFDDYLGKPYLCHSLVSAVDRLLGEGRGRP